MATWDRLQLASAAFGIGDAGDRHGRFLGDSRLLDHLLGGRLGRVVDFQVGRPVLRQLLGIGQTVEGVFRHVARHRDRTFDHRFQRFLATVGGGDDGLTLADEDAQPQVAGFRPLQPLRLSQPLRQRQGSAVEQHRVGGVGSSGLGLADQVFEQREGGVMGIGRHRHLRSVAVSA